MLLNVLDTIPVMEKLIIQDIIKPGPSGKGMSLTARTGMDIDTRKIIKQVFFIKNVILPTDPIQT